MNAIKRFFYNSEESRFRAFWRLTITLISVLVVTRILLIVVTAAVGGMPENENYKLLLQVTVIAISASTVTLITRKLLDKMSMRSLGLCLDFNAVKDLFFGFALSFLMVAVFFFLLLFLGLSSFSGFNTAEGALFEVLVGFFSIGLITAWWEELMFRGVIFQNMEQGLGLKLSIFISCLAYGLIHMGNDNASILSGAIIVLFGFMRLYGYLLTGQLWLSMGMHAGWNFFQGSVFGFNASGFTTTSLMDQELTGALMFTGGDFGPEASLLIIPVLLLALLAMKMWVTRGRGREVEL